MCGSGRPSILLGGWACSRQVVGVDIWVVAVVRGMQLGSWVLVVVGEMREGGWVL